METWRLAADGVFINGKKTKMVTFVQLIQHPTLCGVGDFNATV